MSKKEQSPGLKRHGHHTGELAVIAGEIAGAVIGSAGGPVGVVAGMVVGAVAGTLVGEGLEADEKRVSQHDKELDHVLGISGGDLGAVQPPAPAAAAPEDESSPDWPMRHIDAE